MEQKTKKVKTRRFAGSKIEASEFLIPMVEFAPPLLIVNLSL